MLLRVHINGNWTATEFAEYFTAIQSLSYYWIMDMEYRFAPPRNLEMSLGRLRGRNATITVKQVQFASPGFTDLAGFGAILSEIRQFLEFVIKHISEKENRQQDRELKRLEIIKVKLEILAEMERQNLDHSVAKLIDARDIDTLIEARMDGRLSRVEIIQDE